MPKGCTPAARSYKRKQANYRRTSWAANNVLSTSRKILQKTVVNLDPFAESLKKNNSDLARKNAELQRELAEKSEENRLLQRESFQIKGELLRLQNFRDCIISSNILGKLTLISGDTSRLCESISDALRRTDVSSFLSVESSSDESPVRIPITVRKTNISSFSNRNFRPTARSVEMEIDNSISSPKSSKLSVGRRIVLEDHVDVEDTVMSTPRKTSMLIAGNVTENLNENTQEVFMISPPRKSFKPLADIKIADISPTDQEDFAMASPLPKSSKSSSGRQTVYIPPVEEDTSMTTSQRRSSSHCDIIDVSSSSDCDPDYTPALKSKRKRAKAVRKTSKTSRTPPNFTAHLPLKIVFTSDDKGENSDVKSEASRFTSKNGAQSDEKSSISEPSPVASQNPSKLKRKKMENNEPKVVLEEKKSRFENDVVETPDKDRANGEQNKAIEEIGAEKAITSEAEGEEKWEAKEDKVTMTLSSKRKSRKRKRRLRLVSEDSVSIPISDMTMEMAKGSSNNKENEIDDTTITTDHNIDQDTASSTKKKLEKQSVEEEQEEKENERVKPKAKMSAVRSKKEQAKETDNKKSCTEPKKVDNVKPKLRTKTPSIGVENRDSELEELKRTSSLTNEETSPPESPHRPRRHTSNPVSYVVKLNTKLRQGDKFWCKDK